MRYLALFFLATLLSDCDTIPLEPQECTEIGCDSSVRVEFVMEGTGPSSHSGGFWPEGEYTISVKVDEASYHCTATLPLVCDATNVSCTPDAPFSLTESGCALAPTEHAITGLEIYDVTAEEAPKQIDIEVVHQAQSLGVGSYTFEYESFAPNGEDCGPVCLQAPDKRLDLQSPKQTR